MNDRELDKQIAALEDRGNDHPLLPAINLLSKVLFEVANEVALLREAMYPSDTQQSDQE